MNVFNKIIPLMAVLGLVSISKGQGVFSVDGLAVDTLEEASPFAERQDYFEAELPRGKEDFDKYKRAQNAAGQAAAAHRDVIASAQEAIARGDWEAARKDIEFALQGSPDSPYLLKKAALLFSLAGDYETADKYFSRYMQMKPDDVDTLAAWAAVAVRRKEWSKTEALLTGIFEKSPRNLLAHFQSVVFQIVTGRDKPLRPYNWQHLTLAEIFIISNWLEADRPAYEKLLGEKGYEKLITMTIGPVPVTHLNEARLAAQHAVSAKKREQWQPLRDILMRLRDLGVQSYWVPLMLAQTHFNMGNAEESLAVLTNIQQKYPQLTDAWQNSAFVRIKTGDYEKGLADAQEAQRRSPDNPEIEFTVICALAGAGKTNEMWPMLEAWARRNPQDLKDAMQGNDAFLQAIRDDPRYSDLGKTIR